MLVALGRERLCVDYVSRPSAFVQLYSKLLDGALLDALDQLDRKPAPADALAPFVEQVEAAPRERRPSAGLGHDIRLATETVIGSGLELDAELLQLSAFARM
jgi:hypothetical protein